MRALGWLRFRPATGDVVLAVAIAAIVLAAVSSWSVTGDANASAVRGRLTADAAVTTGLLDRAGTGLTVPPVAVAGLIATLGPDVVTRASFNAFSAPLLDNALLIALEWVPAVPAASLATFEAKIQFAGSLDFTVVESGTDGARVPVGQ